MDEIDRLSEAALRGHRLTWATKLGPQEPSQLVDEDDTTRGDSDSDDGKTDDR